MQHILVRGRLRQSWLIDTKASASPPNGSCIVVALDRSTAIRCKLGHLNHMQTSNKIPPKDLTLNLNQQLTNHKKNTAEKTLFHISFGFWNSLVRSVPALKFHSPITHLKLLLGCTFESRHSITNTLKTSQLRSQHYKKSFQRLKQTEHIQ